MEGYFFHRSLTLWILMFDNHLSRHHLATDDMDKVQSRRQVADVDGGRAFHAEATHFDALGVDDDNAGIAFVIIRGDGQMVTRRIGGDGHFERFFVDIGQLRHIRQNVRVVAVSHQLT